MIPSPPLMEWNGCCGMVHWWDTGLSSGAGLVHCGMFTFQSQSTEALSDYINHHGGSLNDLQRLAKDVRITKLPVHDMKNAAVENTKV